jgi:hypothetical protein
MRALLLLLVAIAVTAPVAAQAPRLPDGTPFFLRKPEPPADALRAYREKPYRPVRVAEVRAAGFLREDDAMAFGKALGPVSPAHIATYSATSVIAIGSDFAVQPPEGMNYGIGDTLTVAEVSRGPRGWGDVVQPTGMLVVATRDDRQVVGTVIAIYGRLREGQVVYRTEPVADPGRATPVPAAGGPTGAVIGSLGNGQLLQAGGHLLIDLGSSDQMRVGDFVSIRRAVEERRNAADTIDEPMATAQVVRLGRESATVKLINVIAPDILPGTPVTRVATLP